MNHADTFEEFLQEKEDEKEKIDWNDRKSKWFQSIELLYKKINAWLAPFVDKDLIKIKDEKLVSITEEYIGKYEVRRLDIYIGNDIISLTPKGTLIIGSYGRIDMKGPKGEIMIIEQEWNEWNFAQRNPKIEYWDINEDSFKSIIQELV